MQHIGGCFTSTTGAAEESAVTRHNTSFALP